MGCQLPYAGERTLCVSGRVRAIVNPRYRPGRRSGIGVPGHGAGRPNSFESIIGAALAVLVVLVRFRQAPVTADTPRPLPGPRPYDMAAPAMQPSDVAGATMQYGPAARWGDTL